jgi:hypothetical protein
MKRMGIEALYRKPNTSKPAPLVCRRLIYLSYAAMSDLSRAT